jgi:hypothetical protein
MGGKRKSTAGGDSARAVRRVGSHGEEVGALVVFILMEMERQKDRGT